MGKQERGEKIGETEKVRREKRRGRKIKGRKEQEKRNKLNKE